MELQGSCRCGAIKFSVLSHTPHPYMRCYCSICRKVDGGGGYAINIMGQVRKDQNLLMHMIPMWFLILLLFGFHLTYLYNNFSNRIIATRYQITCKNAFSAMQNDSMKIIGKNHLKTYATMMPNSKTGKMEPSTNIRSFCSECGSHLWAYDEQWGDWVYPFASAIDTDLPVPPHTVHMMLGSKASWVLPDVRYAWLF